MNNNNNSGDENNTTHTHTHTHTHAYKHTYISKTPANLMIMGDDYYVHENDGGKWDLVSLSLVRITFNTTDE